MAELMKLSMDDFLAHARKSQSPDELSLYIAQHVMQTVAPSLLWITLHDIDIAHSGAFSLYTEAITRTDRICADLWKTVQCSPEYARKTNLFILPDFGRDSDMSPRRQWVPAPPYRRRTLSYHLAYGNGPEHSSERHSRPARTVRGPGAYARTSAWLQRAIQPREPADRGFIISSSASLQSSDFAQYPPQARDLAQRYLPTLTSLPVAFLAVFLRELMGYDWQFPVERAETEAQLHTLRKRSERPDLQQTLARFEALPIAPCFQRIGWAAQPSRAVEEMTAFLWSAEAMDAFM
ncbi:hypothetical protein [Tunturibacter empetritectus]|nr:hypothetical protein [Edaphobacter lichenicola]